MALLSGSRLTHDLATSECLLLACRHAAITVGFKVIDRKRAIMMHMRVKRQHQRLALLHQSNAHVASAMNPTLVAFGTFEPALQIQIVLWKIGRLSTHKQPRRKTAHHRGKLLLNGVSAGLPLLPQHDELRLPLLLWGLVTGSQGAIHCSQVLDILPHLLEGLTCNRQAAVNASGQTLQQHLCTPAQYPSTTSPASSSTPALPGTAKPVASRALSVRPPSRSLHASASGAATAGRSACGASSACGVSWAGQGTRAAV